MSSYTFDIHKTSTKPQSARNSAGNYSYFIKGDISGIQEFIFNVKSEKAARVLKARSVYIQLYTVIAEEFLKRQLEIEDIQSESFYNGGGCFFRHISTATLSFEELQELIKRCEKKINETGETDTIYFALSIVKYNEVTDFKSYWKSVAIASNKDKQQKYTTGDIKAFKAYPYDAKQNDWLDFAHELAKRGAQGFEKDDLEQAQIVFKDKISQLLMKFKLDKRLSAIEKNKNPEDYFYEKIQNILPEWTPKLYTAFETKIDEVRKERNQGKLPHEPKEKIKPTYIIDFDFLAHFAETRTGTDKLAILKMDVDGLGDFFSNMPDPATAKNASEKLKDFFEKDINDLLKKKLEYYNYIDEGQPSIFRNNIYTIFSGGDDCFFVGAWDAVFEWALLIHEEFAAFIKKLQNDLPKQAILKPLTISAGIVIVHSKFPVVRFAELAEDALDAAKATKGKNCICVFDEVLSWEEFKSAKSLAERLRDKINENKQNREIRSLLRKIQDNTEEFKIQHEQASKGSIHLPSVWKLFYFARAYFGKDKATPDLRRIDEKNNSNEHPVVSLINNYYCSLMAAFLKSKPVNPMKYPVIARWTELLTRKNEANDRIQRP